MIKNDDIEFDNRNLQKLKKLLSEAPPKAAVGVLGDKTQRLKIGSGERKTNAEIGAKHEFGLDGMPVRSFLRMPLTMYFKKYIKDSGIFGEMAMQQAIKQMSWIPVVTELGLVGETCVAGAFDTGGFGQWKESNMKFKKNHQTLVETQQLRNSISSEVRDG